MTTCDASPCVPGLRAFQPVPKRPPATLVLARCVSVPRVGYVNTIEGLRDEIEHIEATLDITPIDEVLSQAIILANTDPEVLGDASMRDLGHFRSVLAASIERVEAKGSKDRNWNRTSAVVGTGLSTAAAGLSTLIRDPHAGVSIALGGLLFLGAVLTIVSATATLRGGGWAAISPHLQRALALVDAERTSRNRSEPPPYRTEERLRADAAPASTSRSSTSHNGEATPAEEEVEVASAARKQGP